MHTSSILYTHSSIKLRIVLGNIELSTLKSVFFTRSCGGDLKMEVKTIKKKPPTKRGLYIFEKIKSSF